MFCSWNAEELPITICIAQCQEKKKHTWFHDSRECSLSYSPTKYYKSFLHVITVVVFFKSGLLEGQVMLENSKGFLGTFNEVVEQII